MSELAHSTITVLVQCGFAYGTNYPGYVITIEWFQFWNTCCMAMELSQRQDSRVAKVEREDRHERCSRID